MMRVWAIAINTFREAVRDRVLHGVIGFATAVLLFTLALAELSLNEQRRVVMDIGLASIAVFSAVVAVFLGSSLLYKEIERKTLYVILPKAIRRSEFLLGKYFGVVLTSWVFIAIMGAVQLWVSAYQAEAPGWLAFGGPGVLLGVFAAGLFWSRSRTAVIVPWSVVSLAAAAFAARYAEVDVQLSLASLALTGAEAALLTAVAIFFSSFSTPFLTGGFTLGVWVVGRSAYEMASMKTELLTDEIQDALKVMARIIPNFNLFVPGQHTLQGAGGFGGPWPYVLQAMGYGGAYAAALFIVAAYVFSRRNFL